MTTAHELYCTQEFLELCDKLIAEKDVSPHIVCRSMAQVLGTFISAALPAQQPQLLLDAKGVMDAVVATFAMKDLMESSK